ncbi:MAG: ribbon-helix-helix protein, CopG family [Nitrosomonas sp.]|nr:ribbon-helix-helix protein, CopG family [Nitrosomonas sp.]
MINMNTRVVTAHIPSELAEQIDQLAKRMDRSQGWIVKQALMSWVELEAKRSQLTLEGLADVDAGRLVDHAAVDAWAKNLDK